MPLLCALGSLGAGAAAQCRCCVCLGLGPGSAAGRRCFARLRASVLMPAAVCAWVLVLCRVPLLCGLGVLLPYCPQKSLAIWGLGPTNPWDLCGLGALGFEALPLVVPLPVNCEPPWMLLLQFLHVQQDILPCRFCFVRHTFCQGQPQLRD